MYATKQNKVILPYINCFYRYALTTLTVLSVKFTLLKHFILKELWKDNTTQSFLDQGVSNLCIHKSLQISHQSLCKVLELDNAVILTIFDGELKAHVKYSREYCLTLFIVMTIASFIFLKFSRNRHQNTDNYAINRWPFAD